MAPMEWKRRALIALNSQIKLPRDKVCRLALELDSWWPDLGRGRRILGHRSLPSIQSRSLMRAIQGSEELAAAQIERAERLGAHIITLEDPSYPASLHHLELPPPVLYLRGSLPERPMVAIVGSRNADTYGLEAAAFFARELSAAGLVIVSGFARGVDTAAHHGALEGSAGATVAVLGCGLDVDYPQGNQELAQQLPETGALVSEWPFGTTPLARNFPIRNRIIAALALGTLVVQATMRSGSLITARLSLALGRDVFAVPGRIFDPKAEGPNALIADGALLALRPRDILESLPFTERRQLTAAGRRATKLLAMSDSARDLYSALMPGEGRSCEDLARLTGQPVDRVLSLLLELELGGFLLRHAGPAYSRRA